MLNRATVGRLGLVGLVFIACSTSTSAPTPAPLAVVGVDSSDVLCDPLDTVADDGAQAPVATPTPLVQWVNPFVGTGGVAYGTGTTYPGAQVPGGMARPSPDTSQGGAAPGFMHCAGYAYDDNTIDGFSHFHLHGAGVPDYGGTALMPTVGMTAAKSAPRGHGSPFSHANEKASPGYYSVKLDDTGILAELTATSHVAFHRYTFPAGIDATVIVDDGHLLSDGMSMGVGSVAIDAPNQMVTGSSHVDGGLSGRYGGVTLYFAAHFTQPFKSVGTFASGALSAASTTAQGSDVGAYLGFDASGAAALSVEAHVGVSFIDVAHAQANLKAEDATFDAAHSAATAAWESRLGRVQIQARSDHNRTVFYTALYHTALMPALASDVDGSYRGIDGNVHTASGFRYFTDFSLWDTYRTLHPFLTLVYPEDAKDFAASLTAMGKDAGFLPRWPIGTGESRAMLGDGATVVLADTFVKGVTGWDATSAYQTAKTQATTPRTATPSGGRENVSDWVSLGYVPDDTTVSVSMTLEYGIADNALGNWAQAAGNAADATTFLARGKNWKNLYDPSSYFLYPKTRAGAVDPVNPRGASNAYAEGTAWEYNFLVPHDVSGLVDTMTQPVLEGRLEQLFTRATCNGFSASLPTAYYWPGDEPDIFSAWIFGALGDTTRAGRWLRWTTITNYDVTPAGLPGNDDSGTMSAFYLFAALGFYPISGTDEYVLGSPLIPSATLAAPGGTITISAPAASIKTRFPKSVTLNGAPVSKTIHHKDLLGAKLEFQMSQSAD